MRQLTEITELSDTELEAVSGGFFDFGNSVWQSNTAAKVKCVCIFARRTGHLRSQTLAISNYAFTRMTGPGGLHPRGPFY